MLRKFGSHLRDQWAGFLSLFLVLAGGTAYAANTVFSTDIVNNQVYGSDVRDDTLASGGLGHVDLKPGSVRSSEVANSSLNGGDVAQDSLDGWDIHLLSFADLQPNTLTGGQINEGTLAQAGSGRSDLDACNPQSTTFLSCAQAAVTLDHPGRILVIGSAYYTSDDSDDDSYGGVCRLVDSQGTVYMTRDRFADDSVRVGTVPFTVVTNVLPAGIHSVRIECMEPNSDSGIEFPETSVAVVALSSR